MRLSMKLTASDNRYCGRKLCPALTFRPYSLLRYRCIDRWRFPFFLLFWLRWLRKCPRERLLWPVALCHVSVSRTSVLCLARTCDKAACWDGDPTRLPRWEGPGRLCTGCGELMRAPAIRQSECLIQSVNQFVVGFLNLPAVFLLIHSTGRFLIVLSAFWNANPRDERMMRPSGAWVQHGLESLWNFWSLKTFDLRL